MDKENLKKLRERLKQSQTLSPEQLTQLENLQTLDGVLKLIHKVDNSLVTTLRQENLIEQRDNKMQNLRVFRMEAFEGLRQAYNLDQSTMQEVTQKKENQQRLFAVVMQQMAKQTAQQESSDNKQAKHEGRVKIMGQACLTLIALKLGIDTLKGVQKELQPFATKPTMMPKTQNKTKEEGLDSWQARHPSVIERQNMQPKMLQQQWQKFLQKVKPLAGIIKDLTTSQAIRNILGLPAEKTKKQQKQQKAEKPSEPWSLLNPFKTKPKPRP